MPAALSPPTCAVCQADLMPGSGRRCYYSSACAVEGQRLHRRPGGWPRGAAHPAATLRRSEAGRIRERYRRGDATMRELATQYGIDYRAVWRIVHHRR